MSFHPQTPQSPSRNSPVTTDPNSSISSVTSMSTTTLPTPAHSVNGSLSTQPSDIAHDMSHKMDHGTPGKRKRPVQDTGDRDQEKLHMEQAPVSIDRLHMDVGPMYMVLNNPQPPLEVDGSEDLFKMFDLTTIASKVARVDEKGEKRALRKSYKGHLKTLKVDGHFEPAKKEPEDPDHMLYQLCDVPEQEYYVHFVQGKEVENGLSEDVLGMLDAACTMNKGNVSSVWNPSVLGDLAPGKIAGTGLKGRDTAPGTPAMVGTPKGLGSGLAQMRVAIESNRGRRNLKKRSYGDSSYEGYGEGFPDDDVGVETGYSTAEGDERGPTQKRRKKVQHPSLIVLFLYYCLLTLERYRTLVLPVHFHQSVSRATVQPDMDSSFDFMSTYPSRVPLDIAVIPEKQKNDTRGCHTTSIMTFPLHQRPSPISYGYVLIDGRNQHWRLRTPPKLAQVVRQDQLTLRNSPSPATRMENILRCPWNTVYN
ncbi:Mediator of RNA polymerase II transcription subunit 19 [Zalerion maritima]|uniref:Mediator of RNA polymerase II transcription subunit 19 n=1 Tax=Zalerion maritima TaxID=339359 RepID=A0AAD5RVU2_9PEZI|nr:Mediator of RNA polymerase II transcription subunit 19 [Zalerion maritima]